MQKMKNYLSGCLFVACILATPVCFAQDAGKQPILLKTMGSLLFGGIVQKAENGETFHGDHGYAQYYIPQEARNYPLILWHGVGQSGRSWESTPDGREGYQAILPRKGWPVYIIDQPRRGRAGYTRANDVSKGAQPTSSSESEAWNAFRNGIWVPPGPATLFPNVQFPSDAASIDQFFRQQTPNTGEEPRDNAHRAFMGRSMASLLERTGPGILVTHSNSGQYGWFSGMERPERIRAIVAYEPGQVVFPDDEPVPHIEAGNDLAGKMEEGIVVPASEFKKLTQIPILVVFGDNVSQKPSEIFNVDVWRIARQRAKDFVDAINRHGGDATFVSLPDIGITGNTHAAFADLNNLEVAEQLEKWLVEKHLSGNDSPHSGPCPLNMDRVVTPLQ